MESPIPSWLEVSPPVRQALLSLSPVVALESAVVTHGLPRPINLELARRMEAEVHQAGAQPATVAALHGSLRLGLAAEELEALSLEDQAVKLNLRDLGPARASGMTGGTTVSATMHVAAQAGVRVMATGGIGGVHQGDLGDVSSDLPALATTAVAVVCSGAKAILDLPRTLEWLETAAVPVIGWGVDEFPAFYSRESGLRLAARGDTPEALALILRAHWDLGHRSGALVCVACPAEEAVPRQLIERAVQTAQERAIKEGLSGKELTPYLLSSMAELTDGASLRANLALLRSNARHAGQLAAALNRLEKL